MIRAPACTHILSALPLELREQIYHYAFIPSSSRKSPHQVTVTAADAIQGSDARFPCFLPSACRANKATRIDIGLWFIRQTDFSILYTQHIVHFSQFLSTFPHNQGFEAIRRLDIQLFGRHRPFPGRPNAYIQFVKRCPELTKLRVKFDVWQLLKHHEQRWVPVDSDMDMLEDIASSFGLGALFDLQRLITLTIEVWPKMVARTSTGLQVVVPDCWPAMEKLAKWLRKEFEQRGRKIDVRLVESGNAGLRWDGAVERLGWACN